MRILHLIPAMVGGGAERQLCYLSRELVLRGHDVTVALMSGGPNLERLHATGAHVSRLQLRTATDPRALWEIRSLIRRVRPDVVQTWLSRMDLWAGLAAQVTGRPWLYSERCDPGSFITSGARRAMIQTLVTYRVRTAAAGIVTNSAAAQNWWRRVCHGRIPVRMVANALPFEELDAVPEASLRALGVPDGGEVVLFAGRLEPQKNIPLLTEIAARLLERRRNVHILVAGEGTMSGHLGSILATQIAQSRCHVLGYRPDLWSIMKSADVVLSTSSFEGQPNTVLEAMACCTPVVLTDIPEHRELITPAPRWLFPLGAATTAVDLITNILDDPTRSATVASQARAAIERRTVATMAAEYEAVYFELVAQSPSVIAGSS